MKYFRILMIVVCSLAAIFYLVSKISSNRPMDTEKTPRGNTQKNKPLSLDEMTVKKLQALGYAHWIELEDAAEASEIGVMLYDEVESYKGYNLFKSSSRVFADLIDMHGHVLHTWREPRQIKGGWHHIKVTRKGELFVLEKNHSLAKLDWDSNLLWQTPLTAHHDLDIDPAGNVYTLSRPIKERTFGSYKIPIIDDGIVKLSPQGNILSVINVSLFLGDKLPEKRVEEIHKLKIQNPELGTKFSTKIDVFHINSLELLSRDVPGLGKAGNILISSRYLNLIAVIDIEAMKLVWCWGSDILEYPHNPVVLDNNNVLIFDNGSKRGWSRIIELDPRTGKIVWHYQGSEQKTFFSESRGSNQQLPNGNVLITESDRGRVFEVTRNGKIVWEFLNPEIREDKKARAVIYRMNRIDHHFISQLQQTPFPSP